MELPTGTEPKNNNSTNWTFFSRQLFICSSLISAFFIYGLYMGSLTVIIAQIRREANSTEAVSTETASWLASVPGYSSIVWGIILPFIAYRFGRKIPLILISLNTLITNIIYYRSTSVEELLICQAMTGVLECTTTTITSMILTEYTSPAYRGIFITFKSATFYWGMWISNAIGTFFHWKNTGLVIFVLSAFNLSVIFYPESPYWLATKGRYEECSKNHRWLKGKTKESEDELEKLIASQQEHIVKKNSEQLKLKESIIISVYKVIINENFYKPLFYSTLLLGLYHSSGKFAYSVYAIDVIKKITSSESTAYAGMLILDGVTVFGMYLGTPLTKILKRRTQLFSFSTAGVVFLFILSIYMYMIKYKIFLENKYISIFLLAGFSINISCGPMLIVACCYGELTPLKYRSAFLCFFNLISSAATGIDLKSSPFVFQHLGSHGAFLFYAVLSTAFIYLLYMYLPETKDKTIQEIEKCVAGETNVAQNDKESIPLREIDY